MKSVELIRGGRAVAYLAGKDRRHAWFFEQAIGRPLDTDKAGDVTTYRLSVAGDSQVYAPRAVYRKSKPVDIVNPGRIFPKRHYIYLELPFDLEPRQSYTLRMPELRLNKEEIAFAFDPSRNRSEAIHVSHIGFRPSGPVKHAYLSVWLGDGGAHAYERGQRFTLLDHETGEPVFAGVVGEAWPAERPEKLKRRQNHSLTDVSIIDFSQFSRPGTYRVCVENIGCSYPFSIGQTIWEKPFLTAMKGFYHQRSGIPLGAPYSRFSRPRPYHPDDGVKVYASAVTLMETRNGLNLLGESSNFEALNRHVTDQIVDNAWGGYFDAADWDRRIQHLSSSRYHLELLELFGEHLSNLDLNIPESGDGVPDLLDEALFNIDCYRRLQTSDGGIRGGIEAADHPVRGETSWLESLKVMTYAPGPWSSYVYANVAARAARLLRPFDDKRASVLRQSALHAWSWAEVNVDRFEKQHGKHPRWRSVGDERNLAALEFYRLTGDPQWHALFMEDSVLAPSQLGGTAQFGRGQRHAVFLYARLPDHLGQARLQEAAARVLIENAAAALGFARENAWGLVAMIRGVWFSVGANPMNMTYTTGVGHEWPRNAMVLDSRRTARAVPEGITVFGQVDYAYARERKNSWHMGALDWFLVRKKAIYPDPFAWPVNESYWDIHQWPSACEFTPQGTMGQVSYMWGYLAAQAGRSRSSQ